MPTLGAAQNEIRGFLGVNLRRNRLNIEDYELAKAINADLHNILGTISLRLGRTKLYAAALTDLTLRRLSRVNGVRYQVAGYRLYRNQTSILASLSSNFKTTFSAYRPLADSNIWAFIADNSAMYKDDGTNLRNWGITAPTATPSVAVGAAGSLNGVYMVKFTYVRKDGTTLACESNPSPASAASAALTNDVLSISGLTASSDAQVTHIRIYRTTAGGTSYLFDQDIANGTTTATSSQADSALGSAVETDHDPPVTASWTTVWQDSTWICGNTTNPNWLYYSNRFQPEYFPTTQYLDIGNADDPLQCAVPYAGMLGVFSRRTKYRIIGNLVSGFVPIEAISRRGTPAPKAVISDEHGLIFPARDGIFVTGLASPDQAISEDIEPLFYGESVNDMKPINWDAAGTMAAASYKGRYYFAYPSDNALTPDIIAVYSIDTKKWYFYQYPVQSLLYEEDTDQLIGGSTDGFAYILEDGSTDAGSSIAMTVETKDYYGASPNTRKIFQYFRVDADCLGDTITAEFFIDGTSKGTYSITGSRTAVLNVLPQGSMGFSWRAKITYTGSQRIKIYGIDAISYPLGIS